MNAGRWTAIGLSVGLVAAAAGYLALGPSPLQMEAQAQDAAERITIELGSFYFDGPKGRSDSTANPSVVAELTNNQATTLVFENTANVPHQVVSPLFNDQALADGTLGKDTIRTVAPGESLEIEITPELLTVADGQSLTFGLSCHVGHGTASDHFDQGMHALLKVVPGGESSTDDGDDDDGGPY